MLGSVGCVGSILVCLGAISKAGEGVYLYWGMLNIVPGGNA